MPVSPRSATVLLSAFALAALSTLAAPAAHAQRVIRSPAAVLQNTGGNFNADFVITNAINRSGLSTTFTSGVTAFDAYIAGSPTHTATAAGFEWFTPLNVATSTIVFDLGGTFNIDRFALWNEEFAGISQVSVATSDDAAFSSSTAVGTFTPVPNNPSASSYGAQVFNLTPSAGRYVRLVANGQNVGNGLYVSAGEIAFGTTAVTAAPEPGTVALVGLGLGIAGMAAPLVARRRRAR